MVANAGLEHLGPVDTLTDEELEEMVRVHLYGPFHLVQAALPVMRSQSAGTLVYVPSPMARLGFAWSTGYCH